MRNEPIGIFDSGMGGLTVDARADRRCCRMKGFVYLGDTARLPYGTKSAETVKRYALQARGALMRRREAAGGGLQHRFGAALGALQQALAPLPVIGVIEPGAEAAVVAAPAGPLP